MDPILALAAEPAVWAALFTLIVMEVVLGIDNLVFISILSNKLPLEQQAKARRIGIALALIMRLALLSTLAFIVGLTAPVFELPWQGPANEHGGVQSQPSLVRRTGGFGIGSNGIERTPAGELFKLAQRIADRVDENVDAALQLLNAL